MARRLDPYNLTIEELTEAYINNELGGTPSWEEMFDLQMREVPGGTTAMLGGPQAVASYRKAIQAEEEREAKPTYKEQRQEYAELVQQEPEAVKQKQLHQVKAAESVVRLLLPHVHLTKEVTSMLTSQLIQALTGIKTPPDLEAYIEEHGPLPSFETDVALGVAAELTRHFTSVPKSLALDIPQAIAGPETEFVKATEKWERQQGLVPSAAETFIRQQLPVEELAAQIGGIGGDVAFALGVQLPLMRAIPGMGKLAQPLTKVLSKTGVSWIDAQAPRIATNMVMRGMANMSRRAILETPRIISGDLPIHKALWGWGLTGVFSMSEVVPEYIPSAATNIFVQTVQGTMNNAFQDMLEGRPVTTASLIQGGVMNLFYAIDDASRVAGYSRIKAELDPWIKGITPKSKDLAYRSAEITKIVYKHVEAGHIKPAEIRPILQWAGAEGALRVQAPEVANAVAGGEIKPSKRKPKGLNEVLQETQGILFPTNKAAFGRMLNTDDYKGVPYKLVFGALVKNGLNAKALATYYTESEAQKAKQTNVQAVAKVEGQKVEAAPIEPKAVVKEAEPTKVPWQMTKAELRNWEFRVPEGGVSKTPKTVFDWREHPEEMGETLADLAASRDQFRFNEVLGKGWERDTKIPFSRELIDPIRRGESITVYRASTIGRIVPGAYVTESRAYAQRHGDLHLPQGFIISKLQVYPDELMVYGDPHEFIYIPRNVEIAHQRIIQQALAEGKPVPEAVLAEYSDLAAKAKPEIALPFKELPKLAEKVTQVTADKMAARFEQVGETDVLKTVDDIARDLAEAQRLTAAQVRRVRNMVTVELGKTAIRKRGEVYTLIYTPDEIKTIANEVAKRDIDWVRKQTLSAVEKRQETRLRNMENQGALVTAEIIRRGGVPLLEDKSGEPFEVEEFLAVPRQARAGYWKNLKEINLKRDSKGNLIIPKKYWGKGGGTDELAEALYNDGLLPEPTARALVAALQNEARAAAIGERIAREGEEKWYEAQREKFEAEHKETMAQLDKLLEAGKYEEALKLLTETGLGADVQQLLLRRFVPPPEEVFEAPRKRYRVPRQEELRVEGKGEPKVTEQMREMEAKGQLRVGEGVQRPLFTTEQKPPIRPKEKRYDGVVWAQKVQEYIKQGMSRRQAARKAMEDAVAAWHDKRLATELERAGRFPSKDVQERAQKAVELLGVAPDKQGAFLARYSTLLRGFSERITDPARIAEELRRFGVDTELAVPTRKPSPKRMDLFDAQSATRMRTDVERDAQIAASTERAALYDASARLQTESIGEVKLGQVIENGQIAALRDALITRLDEITFETVPEAVLKDRLRLDTRMEALIRKGKPWSVAVVNIGRLGDINEAVGYSRGDAYIDAVLAGMKTNLPKGTVLGRYTPRGGEFVIVIPRSGVIAQAAVRQAVQAVQTKIKAPDGKDPEFSIGLSENKGEAVSETVAEAITHTRASRKLGRGLVVGHDLYERYKHRLQPPEVAYRPEAVGKTLNVQAKLQVEGYVDVPSLEIRTPADVAEIGKHLTDATREKLVMISVSDENVIQAISVAAIGNLSSVPFTKFQRLPTFAPHLLMEAKGFYVLHNHTSDDPRPTRADIKQYEYLRTAAAHLGLRFLGGVSVGKSQFAFVRPDGLSFAIDVADIPTPTEISYRSPLISVGLESGKQPPVTEDDMPGFLAGVLKKKDYNNQSVFVVPLRPDNTPAGVFKIAHGYDNPHQIAAEVAKLASITFSDKVVLTSGDDPNMFKANLALINHDLQSMYGIRLLDAVSADGKAFHDFEDELPIRTALNESSRDAGTFKQPVPRYRTPPVEDSKLQTDPKAQKLREVIDHIVHYVVNPEDVLQRWWSNLVDRKDWTRKWNTAFQEGLAKLPGGEKLLRAFSTTYGRPGEYLAARAELQAAVSYWADVAIDISRMLHRGWNPDQKRLMLSALQGKAELKREDDPKMFDMVAEARNKLIEAGALAVKVSEQTGIPLLDRTVFLKNFGTYVPRLYKFYELGRGQRLWQPEAWRKEVARNWLLEHGKNADGTALSTEQADDVIASILAREPISIFVLRRGKVRAFKLDLGRFKARKNIPGPIRVLLGEIEEPSYLVGKGLIDVARDALTVDFFNRIATDPTMAISEKQWFNLDAKEQKEYRQIPKGGQLGKGKKAPSIEDISQAGQLAGMYVKKPIYDDIMGYVQWQTDASKLAKRVLGIYKSFKVTLNPPTFFRNIVTNFMFAEMFGDLPVLRLDTYATGLKKMIQGDKDDFYKAVKERGLFRTTFAHSELLPFLGELKGSKSLAEFKNRAHRFIAGTGNAVFRSAAASARFYGAVEDYFKLSVAWYQYKHWGKSIDDAVKIAQNSLFNYSEVTPFVRKVRSSWWGNPFVTFQTKWVPQFTKAIIRKPLTVAKWLAIPSVITAISLKRLGIDRKEYEKMRKQQPVWMRYNPFYILLPWKDKYGRYQWVDATFHFPWGEMAGGEGAAGKVVSTVGWGTRALFGGNPYHGMLTMAIKFFNALETGKPPVDDYFGLEIWKPTDPLDQQISRAMQYVSRSFGPSFLPGGYSYDKIARSMSQQPDYWGRTWAPGQAIAYEFGMKVKPLDIEEATRNKMYDYLNTIGEHEKLLSRIATDFFRETKRSILALTDAERAQLSGYARKLTNQYARQEKLLGKVLDEISTEYDYEQKLDIQAAKSLGSRRLNMSGLQVRSYALKSQMRREIVRLEEILKARYPKGVPTAREELRALQ